MKRYLTIALSMLLMCSAFSCGAVDEGASISSSVDDVFYDDGLEPLFETDDDIKVSGILGKSSEEIEYTHLIDTPLFRGFFSDYEERYPDAYAAKPFKAAVVSYEGKEIYELNMWRVPVMSDDKCVGIISIDCRSGEPGLDSYFSSSYLTGVSMASEGDMVLFTCGCTTYGMYRDGTIVIAGADRDNEYKGTLTFDELDQGYNLVTPESLKEVVYKPEK